jgi:hypothetical protein
VGIKLEDIDEPTNVLYYGDGGTGKTTDVASMANLGPVIIVNAEAGLKAKALRARGVDVSNIEIWPEPGQAITFDGLEELHLECLRRCEKGKLAGVAWDSITEIHQALLAQATAHLTARAERAGKERDRFSIELADYGLMTEMVRTLVRRFRDLPCHFAITALAKRQQDDDGTVSYVPAVTPALVNDLIGWVDIVAHTTVGAVGEREEYRGLFRAVGKYRGKDRLGLLPKYLVDPTFDRIVAYVDEELVAEKDPVMIAAREARAALAEAETTETGGN